MKMANKIALAALIIMLSAALTAPGVAAQVDPQPLSTHGELITIPTARIMAYRGRVGAEYRQNRSRIYGVFRLENFMELGGQVQDHPVHDEELGLLLKARILTEEDERPAVAAGIRGTSPYVSVSKYLGENFDLHFGIGDSQPDGLFIGLNYVHNSEVQGIAYVEDDDGFSLPRTNLMLEFAGDDINIGARTQLAPELSGELSVIGMNSVKAGIDFTF